MNEPARNQPPHPDSDQPRTQPHFGQRNPQQEQPGKGQPRPQPVPPGQPQQPGHPYSQPQPGYSPYPPTQPPSTRGPKILTFVGAGVLAIGVIALVFAIIGLVSLVPTGIVDAEGEPGPDALLSIDGSEPASLDSTGDISYAFWEVTNSTDDSILSPSAVEVTGPDGEMVIVRSASVSGSFNLNGVRSRTFGEFRAPEAGTYLITIRPSAGTDVDSLERVIVTEATEFGGFFGGVFGSAALMITGIGGLIVGFAVTVAGIIWWVVANNRRKRFAA